MKEPEKKKRVLTLVYIMKDDEILLGLKKRGFGQGNWNGFGGKVNVDETIVDCAIREVKEECGLALNSVDLECMAIIDFEFKGDPVHLEVHVFRADRFFGEVSESDEMAPKWFKISDIPYEQMWPDDVIWHPHFFQGQKFRAQFLFEGTDKILSHTLVPVQEL